MIRSLSIALLLALAFGLASCDFPNDPPLLSSNGDNGQSKYLLKLSESYRYGYLVGFDYSTEAFRLTDTVRIASAPSGEYFRMRYEHYDLSGERPERIILLLPFLRNTDTGLEYYISNPPTELDSLNQDLDPILFWKFPYPAEVGAYWDNPTRPWRVELATKDTLVYSNDGIQGYKCWMYTITYTAGASPLLYYNVFFIPGEAVFKIENVPEQITAVTYFWSWDSE